MDVLQPFGVFVLVLECALWVEHTIITAVCSVVFSCGAFFFFPEKRHITLRCETDDPEMFSFLLLQTFELVLCFWRTFCRFNGRLAFK